MLCLLKIKHLGIFVNLCKTHKKRNKIEGRSITCSHIWHVNISKCVYWLETHSVKVWWRYVLPNVNAAHFWDVFFRHRAVFPSGNKRTVLEIINPAPLGLTKIMYPTDRYILGLHISWCKQERGHRRRQNAYSGNANLSKIRDSFLRQCLGLGVPYSALSKELKLVM